MDILIVTQYFYPENFRINDLALGLQEKGHRVTILTGIPNYPEGRYYQGYSAFRIKDRYEGMEIYRVPLVSRGKSMGLRLAVNFLSFAFFASFLGPLYFRNRKFDGIFVFEISPVTVAIPAILLKRLKKAPLFLWVLDLWPETLVATGALQTPRALKWVERLVRWIYRQSDRILLASKAFSPQVEKLGGEESRIRYFPNWSEKIFTRGISSGPKLPDLPTGFRIMFAGNIGEAQDFGTILNAADLLKGNEGIHWIILGDGRNRPWVENEIRARGLSGRVHLLGKYPLDMMPHFLCKADGLLVTLKKNPIFSLTVPAKIQVYLASGKPLVGALDGEGKRIVEEAGAGVIAPAENARLLAESVTYLYNLPPSERQKMGQRGRAYCSENFSREVLFRKLEGWFAEAISDQPENEGRFPR